MILDHMLSDVLGGLDCPWVTWFFSGFGLKNTYICGDQRISLGFRKDGSQRWAQDEYLQGTTGRGEV